VTAWTRIELGRLGPDETAAQIAGVLDSTVDPSVAERLHARCDGNPFLVEELLAAGPDTDPLPTGTRDILLRRVRRLSTVDQAGLLAIAVAGRRADHALLARVLGLDADALADRLRRAVDEQLLVVDGDGYAFPARAGGVGPARRGAAGRAGPPAPRVRRDTGARRTSGEADATSATAAAELAYHWDGAGEPARALVACVDAGLAAERLFAPAEARQHFDRALARWPVAGPTRSPLDLVELCRHGPRRPRSRATPGTPSP
jgi:hypothetical protein